MKDIDPVSFTTISVSGRGFLYVDPLPLLVHAAPSLSKRTACGLKCEVGVWIGRDYNCPFCKKVKTAPFWRRRALQAQIKTLLMR